MNPLTAIALDESAPRWIVLLFLQITVAVALGLLGSAFFRRDAASRHALLCVTLFAIVVCPLVTWLCDRTGWTVLEIVVSPARPRSAQVLSDNPVGNAPLRGGHDSAAVTSDILADGNPAVLGAGKPPGVSTLNEERPTIVNPHGTRTAKPVASVTSAAEPARPAFSLAGHATRVALTVWLIGCLFFVARMVHGWRVVRRLCREATPFDHSRWPDVDARLGALFGRRQRPRILVSDRIATAAAVGLFRPAILVPRRYIGVCSIEDFLPVLTHEAAHLVRRDHIISVLQRLAEAAYWPHPFVHALNRRLSRAREEVCDNYVLQGRDPESYANVLLRLVESSQGRPLPPAVLAFLNGRWKLEERVAGLLDPTRTRSVVSSRRVLVIAATIFGIFSLAFGGLRLTAARENLVIAADSENVSDPLPAGALFRLGASRLRHEGWHKNVAYAADGRVLVSCSERSLKFWDAKTGKLLRQTSLADTVHRAMRVLPDGKQVATLGARIEKGAGKSGTWGLRMWDVDSGALVSEISPDRATPGEMHTMAISPDGALAFLGDSRGFIQIYELATGTRMLQYHVADLHDVLGIALSPDGKVAAITTGSNQLYLWNWSSGDDLVMLDSGRRNLGAAFSPNGKLLAVGGDSPEDVQLWDVTSQTLLHSLADTPQAPLRVEELAFTPDGTRLAAANAVSLADRFVSAVLLWDVESGKLVKRFTAQGMHPRSLSISPDGRSIASVDWDAGFRVWDVETGRSVGNAMEGHGGFVRAVEYSPSSENIVTAAEDRTARIWDFRTGRELARLVHDAKLSALAQSADGRLIATAGQNDVVTLWQASPLQKMHTIQGDRQLGGALALAIAPDGSEVLAFEDDLQLRVWGAADGLPRRSFRIRPSGMKLESDGEKPAGNFRSIREEIWRLVSAHAFTSDGSKLVLAGSDGSWWTFDTQSGKELARQRLDVLPHTMAIAPDGRQIAFDGRMRPNADTPASPAVETKPTSELVVVNFSTGSTMWRTRRRELLPGRAGSGPLRFSHDGKLLAAVLHGKDDRTIELYDAATGRLRHVIAGGDPVGWSDQGLAFSGDGKRLASVQADATVLVWDVDALEN
jgi:WD40 repeat protein